MYVDEIEINKKYYGEGYEVYRLANRSTPKEFCDVICSNYGITLCGLLCPGLGSITAPGLGKEQFLLLDTESLAGHFLEKRWSTQVADDNIDRLIDTLRQVEEDKKEWKIDNFYMVGTESTALRQMQMAGQHDNNADAMISGWPRYKCHYGTWKKDISDAEITELGLDYDGKDVALLEFIHSKFCAYVKEIERDTGNNEVKTVT